MRSEMNLLNQRTNRLKRYNLNGLSVDTTLLKTINNSTLKLDN